MPGNGGGGGGFAAGRGGRGGGFAAATDAYLKFSPPRGNGGCITGSGGATGGADSRFGNKDFSGDGGARYAF